jgi:hypothetical protein
MDETAFFLDFVALWRRSCDSFVCGLTVLSHVTRKKQTVGVAINEESI